MSLLIRHRMQFMKEESRAFQALLLLVIAVAALRAFTNTNVNEDLFLSLAVGADILRNGVLHPDHWSFTQPPHVWINQAWLSHGLLSAAYQTLGCSGPLLIKAAALVGCVLISFMCGLRLTSLPTAALAASTLGLSAVAPFVALRPENIGVILFCALLFLTLTRMSWLMRILGSALVMALWANAHGSFMFGLAMLFLCACVSIIALVTKLDPQETAHSCAARWSTALACLAVAAFVNPYGVDNILMPFTQVGSQVVTHNSADWVSLLDSVAYTRYLIGPGAVYAYLLQLIVIVALVLWAGSTRRLNSLVLDSPTLTAIVISVTLVALSIKFRRLVLFAGLGLIPLTAILFAMVGAKARALLRLPVRVAAYGVSVLLAAYIAYGSVLPYIPGNPFRPARPVTRELMAFDNFSPGVVSFLQSTPLRKAVLPGWEISSYLMSNIPDIKLFMDVRDQSYYSSDVISEYFRALGVIPAELEEVRTILDKHGVAIAALTMDVMDFQAAVRLMRLQEWTIIYADARSLCPVRRSALTAVTGADRKLFVYRNKEVEVITQAWREYFETGVLHEPTLTGMKAIALADPQPNYFRMIARKAEAATLLHPDVLRYLVGSIPQLQALITPLRTGSGAALESLEVVFALLGEDSRARNDSLNAQLYLTAAAKAQRRLSILRDKYEGRLFPF